MLDSGPGRPAVNGDTPVALVIKVFLSFQHTVMTLNFRTDRTGHTVQTQIRVFTVSL